MSKQVNTSYFEKVYEDIQLAAHIKNVCVDIIEKNNAIFTSKINKVEGFYPAPSGEIDLKPLMVKWNALITSGQLLNKLVKPTDTVKRKNEIQENLKLLKNNPESLRLSNGFQGLENTLGRDKISLLAKEKRLQEEKVKTYREKTPVYTERKKLFDALNIERLRQSQQLIEKVTKTRVDIRK